MQWTEEHESIRETVAKFVDNEINPYVDQWEEDGIFPAKEVFKKLGDLGMLGITKPIEYGGLGLDYSYGIVFAEEMGRINCGGVSTGIGVQTDMATPALARFGSDELRNEFLVPAITGEAVFSIAVSEPQAGSDVAGIQTNGVKDGDDYIINGSKMWITNSTQADFFCTLINSSEGPSNTSGVSVDKPLKKLGLHSSDTAQIFFDNVRVPQRNRIGEEGMGFIYQMMQFQEERLFAAAASLKGMEHNIQSTIEYTRERETFGKPILKNQVVQFRLAELQTEIEALRALVYDAVEGYIHGEDVLTKASMAKLKSGRLSREVSDSCLQYWGGMGFMWETGITRAYRDSRLGSIGGGSDEVMLGIISKQMGILD